MKNSVIKYVELVKVEDFPTAQDFNGSNTEFALEKQIDYLKKLSAFNEKEYGDCAQPVVSEEECESILSQIDIDCANVYRERTYFKNVSAWLEREKEARSCVLYTKKTAVKDRTILFQDGDNYPVPCAKLQAKKSLTYAQFEVDMGKEFQTPLRGGIWTMVSGRVIEFRNGIQEILKIQFYCDGSCCARIGEPDEWHHNNILLGKIKYDQAFPFTVQFDNGIAYIMGFGERREIKLLTKTLPDTVFIGGGMCIVNNWKVKPILLKTVDEKAWNPFEKIVKEKTVRESIGTVDLPYVVGTEKNQDKTLVIEKHWNYVKDNRRTFLCCAAIDPDGEIYINGRKIVDTHNVGRLEVDITNDLREGDNNIIIRVNPRAPEILYSWHKHQDPYNGWFIGSVYLEKRAGTHVEWMQLKTTEARDTLRGLIFLRLKKEDVESYVVKCYARDKEEEILLGETLVSSKKAEIPFAFEGRSWSPRDPYLYEVIMRLYKDGVLMDEYVEKTGFRTIEQCDGDVVLNGEKEILKGALLMQFLPPYDEIPLNHVCPTDKQIVWQAMLAKKMGCNAIRMHQLGYGTNDERQAKVFDALGIQAIWITREIDSVSNICWNGEWKQKSYYQKQIEEVINHPSIIAWEGANEVYLTRKDTDCIYTSFVRGLKEIDDTRLICPVSHLYYANDSYDKGCEYYQDNGTQDEYFRNVQACKEWTDDLVVRSAHTYDWLLGYGKDWEKFRLQDWSAQPALLENDKRAYIVSEYAIIGQQNPKNAPTEKQSYELSDERLLGYHFQENEWRVSQAYQSLAARYATKYMLSKGVDGLFWCCLSGGANDATYLKPPIDFFGYPKQAFYALKECFEDTVCFDDGCDVVWGTRHTIKPLLLRYGKAEPKSVAIEIYDENETLVTQKTYRDLPTNEKMNRLPEWTVSLQPNAYYVIKFLVQYV